MNLKEQFLNIDQYDEYEKKKSMFAALDFSDPVIVKHYMKLLNNTGIPKKNAFQKNGVHTDFKSNK